MSANCKYEEIKPYLSYKTFVKHNSKAINHEEQIVRHFPLIYEICLLIIYPFHFS
jgi:hypothetical protein